MKSYKMVLFGVQLLINCLEIQYGSLDKVISNPEKETLALRDIHQILEKYGV